MCEFFVTDSNPGFVVARVDRGANSLVFYRKAFLESARTA
jgi:hypothetical protein